MRLFLASAVAASLAAVLFAQAPETRRDPPSANEAIDAGTAWLLRAQRPDGSWNGPEPDLYRGMTSLAAYTLIKCGRPPDHPAIKTAVASLRAWPIDRTYDLGCALMLLHAMGEARPKDVIKPLADRLLATMSNGKRARGARWGYPNDREGTDDAHTDLSNTQYAILGLRAARLAGIKAGSPLFWETVARDTLDEQAPYGGFGYLHREAASASMTVAGVTILVVCSEAIGPGIDPNLDKRIKTGIERGLRWLDDDWAVDHAIDLRLKERTNDRWLYYYLYGLERLAAFTEKETIGRHPWYSEGSAQLLKSVKKTGQWGGGDSDTCFALLFLRRGSRVSGASEKQKHESLSAADSAILVAMDGENPVRAWIRGAGPRLQEKLKTGAEIQRLDWVVDEAVITSIPSPSVDALSSKACGLEYTIPSNGSHRIVARLALAGEKGSASETLESNPLVLEVDNVEEPRHREAVRDVKKNLLSPSRVTMTASTSLDAGRVPALAVDARYGTSWLCAKGDLDPWIQLAMPGGPRAGVLKLASAGPFGDDGDYYGRPRDLDLVINGGEPIAVRLADTVRRKQSIRMPQGPLRSIQIRIRSMWPGRWEPNVCGFSEIELHDADPEGAADLLVSSERAEVILPFARTEPVKWRHVFDEPASDWAQPSFADSAWKEGEAGFGTKVMAYAPIRTAWKSKEIWIRRSFNWPKDGGELRIEIDHDDDAEVFVNGVLAAKAPKFSFGGYFSLPVSAEAQATLRPGANVIAVHCTNTASVSYLDVGLVRMLPIRPVAAGK